MNLVQGLWDFNIIFYSGSKVDPPHPPPWFQPWWRSCPAWRAAWWGTPSSCSWWGSRRPACRGWTWPAAGRTTSSPAGSGCAARSRPWRFWSSWWRRPLPSPAGWRSGRRPASVEGGPGQSLQQNIKEEARDPRRPVHPPTRLLVARRSASLINLAFCFCGCKNNQAHMVYKPYSSLPLHIFYCLCAHLSCFFCCCWRLICVF